MSPDKLAKFSQMRHIIHRTEMLFFLFFLSITLKAIEEQFNIQAQFTASGLK